jgi:hypothetical protein
MVQLRIFNPTFFGLTITIELTFMEIDFFSIRAMYHYIKQKKKGTNPSIKKTPHSTTLDKITLYTQETTNATTGTQPFRNHHGEPRAWRKDKPLAPTMVHNKASSIATWRAAATLGKEPRKTMVSVLPNGLVTENDKRVKCSSNLSLDLLTGMTPPLFKDFVDQLWHKFEIFDVV